MAESNYQSPQAITDNESANLNHFHARSDNLLGCQVYITPSLAPLLLYSRWDGKSSCQVYNLRERFSVLSSFRQVGAGGTKQQARQTMVFSP